MKLVAKGRTLKVLKQAIDKRVLPINVQKLVEAATNHKQRAEP